MSDAESESAVYFQTILVIGMVYVAYNFILAMHRTAEINDIGFQEEKAAVINKLGEPVEVYICKDGTTPSPYLTADSLCKGNVYEVDTFARCHITLICPGWNYVAFSQAGRVVSKYGYAVPLI